MADLTGIKIEPHIKLPKIQIGKSGNKNAGGDGGSIFIFSKTIKGSGEISVDGGDGKAGGKGGSIHIESEDNQFKGKISAKGGKRFK